MIFVFNSQNKTVTTQHLRKKKCLKEKSVCDSAFKKPNHNH